MREDIHIEMALAIALPRVRGDYGQLEQVVMNLAVNAQDAMPQGGRLVIKTARVKLDESLENHEKDVEPGYYVMVAIRDTGSGMDAHTLEQIFEPFFTTKEKEKGKGYKMTLLPMRVPSMGGEVHRKTIYRNCPDSKGPGSFGQLKGNVPLSKSIVH